MKLSPGPVSVHPSHASCGAGRRQSSVTGCEAKPSAVERRNMIQFPNDGVRLQRAGPTPRGVRSLATGAGNDKSVSLSRSRGDIETAESGHSQSVR
eukprot:scaffold25920_cov64-Phaeocystis_antarctica.AAC.2